MHLCSHNPGPSAWVASWVRYPATRLLSFQAGLVLSLLGDMTGQQAARSAIGTLARFDGALDSCTISAFDSRQRKCPPLATCGRRAMTRFPLRLEGIGTRVSSVRELRVRTCWLSVWAGKPGDGCSSCQYRIQYLFTLCLLHAKPTGDGADRRRVWGTPPTTVWRLFCFRTDTDLAHVPGHYVPLNPPDTGDPVSPSFLLSSPNSSTATGGSHEGREGPRRNTPLQMPSSSAVATTCSVRLSQRPIPQGLYRT